jgi:hypothetical protein
MSASGVFSSFFEQAASVRVALHATSNNRVEYAENMASPFLSAFRIPTSWLF